MRGVHVRLPRHDHPAVPPPLPLQRLRGLPALPGQQLSHLPRSLQGSSPGTLQYHLLMLRIWDVYPRSRIQDPNLFFPSRIKGQKDSGSQIRIRSKEVKFFMFFPDSDLYFLPIPDPGSRGLKDTRSQNPGQQLSHLPRSLQGSTPGTLLPLTSVADPGCLSRIQDSIFFPSRFPGPDPKQKSIFNTKNCFKWDAGCSCRIRIPDPDLEFFTYPGSRGQKGTGSRANNCPICRAPLRALLQVPYYHLQVSCGSGMVIPDPGSKFFPSPISEPRPTNVPFAARALLQVPTTYPPVFGIRDVYPGSEFFSSWIQGQKDSGSRIRIRSKEFKYF